MMNDCRIKRGVFLIFLMGLLVLLWAFVDHPDQVAFHTEPSTGTTYLTYTSWDKTSGVILITDQYGETLFYSSTPVSTVGSGKFLHAVPLESLRPNATYHYSINGLSSGDFQTPILPESIDTPCSI